MKVGKLSKRERERERGDERSQTAVCDLQSGWLHMSNHWYSVATAPVTITSVYLVILVSSNENETLFITAWHLHALHSFSPVLSESMSTIYAVAFLHPQSHMHSISLTPPWQNFSLPHPYLLAKVPLNNYVYINTSFNQSSNKWGLLMQKLIK